MSYDSSSNDLPPVASAAATLAYDQLLAFPGLFRDVAHCRVRVYYGAPVRVPVVIITEIEEDDPKRGWKRNDGLSVTNGAERIAATVHDALLPGVPFFWLIEHYPDQGSEAERARRPELAEHFALVTFNERGWREISGPIQAPGRRYTGYGTTWKHLAKAQVEAIIGQPLGD